LDDNRKPFLIYTNVNTNDSTSSSTTEEHKNDGILKSVWHKLTDHTRSNTTSSSKDDSSKEPKDKDSGAEASTGSEKKE